MVEGEGFLCGVCLGGGEAVWGFIGGDGWSGLVLLLRVVGGVKMC